VSQIRFDNYYLAEVIKVQEQQKRIEMEMQSKRIQLDWENALLKPKAREKKMTISQTVQRSRLLKLKKNEILPGQREYRLISGGDDGVIKWWNLVYTPSIPSENQIKQMIVAVDARTITNLKSCHELYLAVNA
jgi:hypothetical protein